MYEGKRGVSVMIKKDHIERIKNENIKEILLSCMHAANFKKKHDASLKKVNMTDCLVDTAIEKLAQEILWLERDYNNLKQLIENKVTE